MLLQNNSPNCFFGLQGCQCQAQFSYPSCLIFPLGIKRHNPIWGGGGVDHAYAPG